MFVRRSVTVFEENFCCYFGKLLFLEMIAATMCIQMYLFVEARCIFVVFEKMLKMLKKVFVEFCSGFLTNVWKASATLHQLFFGHRACGQNVLKLFFHCINSTFHLFTCDIDRIFEDGWAWYFCALCVLTLKLFGNSGLFAMNDTGDAKMCVFFVVIFDH